MLPGVSLQMWFGFNELLKKTEEERSKSRNSELCVAVLHKTQPQPAPELITVYLNVRVSLMP